MEKQQPTPHLPDRLLDPKLPAVHAGFTAACIDARSGSLPPDIETQELENRKLEQL